MQIDSFIGVDDFLQFASRSGFTSQIAYHVFNKLVRDYWGEKQFGLEAQPDISLPPRRIRNSAYRLVFRLGDLININPNELQSDGCVRFMIGLQTYLVKKLSEGEEVAK